MKILIVDHSCHARTNSMDFFSELLSERFEVDLFYYDECYRCEIPRSKKKWADVIVFWEFLPSRFMMGVPGKKCVFVPMYDNEWASKWQWRRLAMAQMSVLSFCRKLTEHARRCGVQNLLEVRFSPDPSEYPNMTGDPRKVILWERGNFGFEVIKKMFRPEDVDSVTVIRRDEEMLPCRRISRDDEMLYNVKIRHGGFVPKDEYVKILSEPGVYVAPRFKEGIGMSFLEQMAMGKCVIAHNDATMNEYIVSGENGILVDMRNPRRIRGEEIRRVRDNVIGSVEKMYEEWIKDRKKILGFFESLKNVENLRSSWQIGLLLTYSLYLMEGFLMRFFELCNCRKAKL